MASDVRPAQPKSILRGHKTQVHAAAFVRNNERLLTGDSEGFVVAWDLTIMRPRAVWQAHTKAILGIAGWGRDRVITHGRDNKLMIWKLAQEDEAQLSTTLPLDPCPESRPQPWVLHMLEVNTMNFCSFSYCPTSVESEILIAVPNTLASEAIDIFHLPSQRRVHTVKVGAEKNGMVMAVSLFRQGHSLTLIAGFENGLAAVAQLGDDSTSTWTVEYQNTSHTQPILSLDVSPDRSFFLTSAADAVIAKHPVPSPSHTITALQTEPLKKINTKHSGQQSLRIRGDNLIFATAGWDSKIRVYSVKTMKEVAVLKWHQVGCYAAAFSDILSASSPSRENTAATSSENATNIQDTAKDSTEGAAKEEVMAAVAPIPRLVDMTVRDKRIHQAKTAHWLAAGSKDGKVSLWDVF